jgi:hypothetical protein
MVSMGVGVELLARADLRSFDAQNSSSIASTNSDEGLLIHLQRHQARIVRPQIHLPSLASITATYGLHDWTRLAIPSLPPTHNITSPIKLGIACDSTAKPDTPSVSISLPSELEWRECVRGR